MQTSVGYRSAAAKPACRMLASVASPMLRSLPGRGPAHCGARARGGAIHVANFTADSPVAPDFVRNQDGTFDLSAAPPFSLQDLRNAIPEHCWQKNAWRSVAYLLADVAVVAGLAVAAYTVNAWWAWPLYWMAQGSMFWSLFVVGHDCGHQSFSNSRALNDFLGNLIHSTILVPYHGWRISHRKHHGNHGHVENDESWHPTTKGLYDSLEPSARVGRNTFPIPLLAFPFYLFTRSPGKTGSHFDPSADLFVPAEKPLVLTSNACLIAMIGVLAAATYALGLPAIINLYVMPFWVYIMWLDAVTYLHHHGPDDKEEKMPWYRGEEWSYLRGGLTALDRDYGVFHGLHHDIGTHVIHHLFPQIPHYHLKDATAACKPVMGPYYREPKPSGVLPTHLWGALSRSFGQDHFVQDTGDIVFYEKDENAVKLPLVG